MFDFPVTEHKTYTKNFLKTVIFQIQFEKYIDLRDKAAKIEGLFKKDFPRFSSGQNKGVEIRLNNEKPNFQQIEGGLNINLKSEDGQRVMDITETSLTLRVGGPAYESFGRFKENLDKFKDFLDLCGIDEISRLAIRKVNLVEFKNNENPSDVLKLLLNPVLVNHVDEFPNKKFIHHSIQSINYKKDKDFLNLKYGLNFPPQLNSEIGQVIIDIDVFKQDNIGSENIMKTFGKINSEIFNIFSWVINENAKNLLNT